MFQRTAPAFPSSSLAHSINVTSRVLIGRITKQHPFDLRRVECVITRQGEFSYPNKGHPLRPILLGGANNVVKWGGFDQWTVTVDVFVLRLLVFVVKSCRLCNNWRVTLYQNITSFLSKEQPHHVLDQIVYCDLTSEKLVDLDVTLEMVPKFKFRSRERSHKKASSEVDGGTAFQLWDELEVALMGEALEESLNAFYYYFISELYLFVAKRMLNL
ncbi:hypothetical protein J6590_001426 [Homalodisca vitripennis]|nr:hypothetical protein J6590_001426 [Homalodisca vitripennis]